jgi:uroporphyrinogen decarboxylase
MSTSRERVLMAINHRQPDRVPIDLGAHRSSGIMAIAYNKLKKLLGITSGDIYVYDFIQQLAIVEPAVLERFGVDTIELGRGFSLRPEDWHDWVLPDGTPCKIPAYINPVRVGDEWRVYHQDGTLLTVQKKDCLYFEQVCYPLALSEDDTFANLEADKTRCMWMSLVSPPAQYALDAEGIPVLTAGAQALRASTDRAIVGLFGANFLEAGQMLFGNDVFLYMMAAEPKRVHRFMDRLLEGYLDQLAKYLATVGQYIDVINFGDDLGMQTGPQISPRMYWEFIQPREKAMWQRVKQLSDVKIMLHTCGGIYPLVPGLIEAGLDIVQPVQTTCHQMEPERLKREFGKDLCFWGGGSNTRDVLPHGTPAQVAEDVRKRVAVLAPGGGFVFAQIHNIMADVPPENILAMLDAVNS